MAYKNVILVGAAGSLGEPTLAALLAANSFKVSVLTRKSSKSTYPAKVKVVPVDFTNHDELVEAFKGQDAVVVTMGDFHSLHDLQTFMIDAAIEAGVKRFVPSNWGFDLESGPGSWQELLIPKYKTRDYLRQKAKEGKITWTTVINGLFLDWALELGYLNFDFTKKTVGVFDEGTNPIMLTTLSSVADSVVGILSNPSATENKFIRIHDFLASNLDVIHAVEFITGIQFEKSTVDTDELMETGRKMEKSDASVGVQALALLWGRQRGGEWDENDESGLVGLVKKDLKEEAEKSLRKMGVLAK